MLNQLKSFIEKQYLARVRENVKLSLYCQLKENLKREQYLDIKDTMMRKSVTQIRLSISISYLLKLEGTLAQAVIPGFVHYVNVQ